MGPILPRRTRRWASKGLTSRNQRSFGPAPIRRRRCGGCRTGTGIRTLGAARSRRRFSTDNWRSSSASGPAPPGTTSANSRAGRPWVEVLRRSGTWSGLVRTPTAVGQTGCAARYAEGGGGEPGQGKPTWNSGRPSSKHRLQAPRPRQESNAAGSQRCQNGQPPGWGRSALHRIG